MSFRLCHRAIYIGELPSGGWWVRKGGGGAGCRIPLNRAMLDRFSAHDLSLSIVNRRNRRRLVSLIAECEFHKFVMIPAIVACVLKSAIQPRSSLRPSYLLKHPPCLPTALILATSTSSATNPGVTDLSRTR